MSEISNSIFNAVDILVDKKLSNYKADITAPYVICDNSKAAEGIYKVSNNKDVGTVSFEVYKQSTDNTTYKIGDSVYILIPGGDYKEKKFILGFSSEYEAKDRIVPQQKEPIDVFVSLGENYAPLLGASSPATLALNSNEKSLLISSVTLSEPRILVNYKKIRISVVLNVNLNNKTIVNQNSSSYVIKFIVHDNSNGREFIYSLGSNDIVSNLYYFGENYYNFTKDVSIESDNFSVDAYSIVLEQEGELTNLNGKTEGISGKINLKDVTISFGCLASEYQDGIYAYSENNIKTFFGSNLFPVGIKINKNKEEITSLKDFFGEGNDGLVYWEQLVNGEWKAFINEENEFITSVNVTDDIFNLTIRSYLGLKKEDEVEIWGKKFSNSLSFDNGIKTQYNYNIKVFSELGSLIQRSSFTKLIIKIYQNNKEITLNNHYSFTDTTGTTKELRYFWYKDNELVSDENNFSVAVEGSSIPLEAGVNYSCRVEIGITEEETSTWIKKDEAFDTITLFAFEEPIATTLCEIVTDYNEIGVAYHNNENVSSVQYFPSTEVSFGLSKLVGTKNEYSLEELGSNEAIDYYYQKKDSEGNWYSYNRGIINTLKNNTISIEPIKFENAYEEYVNYKDYERRIYIQWRKDTFSPWLSSDLSGTDWTTVAPFVYEKRGKDYQLTSDTVYNSAKTYFKISGYEVLAGKILYLVLAKGNILSNFETTAFGFNVLTENGTKGIKFEAARGMRFYAGDDTADKHIISIYSGAANGDQGKEVFYVNNQGNVYLNNLHAEGEIHTEDNVTFFSPLNTENIRVSSFRGLLSLIPAYTTSYYSNWERSSKSAILPSRSNLDLRQVYFLSKLMIEKTNIHIETNNFSLITNDTEYNIVLVVSIIEHNTSQRKLVSSEQQLTANSVFNIRIVNLFNQAELNLLDDKNQYYIELEVIKNYLVANSNASPWGTTNQIDGTDIVSFPPTLVLDAVLSLDGANELNGVGKEKLEAVFKTIQFQSVNFSATKYGGCNASQAYFSNLTSSNAKMLNIKDVSTLKFFSNAIYCYSAQSRAGFHVPNYVDVFEQDVKEKFSSSEKKFATLLPYGTDVSFIGASTITLPISDSTQNPVKYDIPFVFRQSFGDYFTPYKGLSGESDDYSSINLINTLTEKKDTYDFDYAEEDSPPFNWAARYNELYTYNSNTNTYQKNTSSTYSSTTTYFSRITRYGFSDFRSSNDFYYQPNSWSKQISTNASLNFGTLYAPRISFDTGPSLRGTLVISSDKIEAVRGTLDVDGNVTRYYQTNAEKLFEESLIQIDAPAALDDIIPIIGVRLAQYNNRFYFLGVSGSRGWILGRVNKGASDYSGVYTGNSYDSESSTQYRQLSLYNLVNIMKKG